MSDIATKLTYLNETKSQLKDMINYGLPTENQITNETTFRNYVKGIFEAFIESLRDSTTLYTNLPKKSGNGTQITLNDTANAPMRITLKASELTQDGTPTPSSPQDIHTISGSNSIVVCGKNYLDLTKHTNTLASNITILSPNSYQCVVTGHRQGKVVSPIELEPNTDYKISCNVDSNASYSIIDYIKGTKNGVSTNIVNSQYFNYFKNGYSFNSGDYDSWEISFYIVGNSSSYAGQTLVLDELMIEKGSTKTSYVPYQEPQKAQLNLPVENLFDISTITENTYIDENGNTGTSSVSNLSDYIEVSPSTQYILSYTYSSLLNQNARNIVYYDASKTLVGGITYSPSNKTNQFTTLNNTKFIRFSYDKNISDIQLEKGTKSNSYTPYGTTPIEYCKIGNYEDRIFKNISGDTDYSSEREDGAWYIKKNIGKVVLDGTEANWDTTDSGLATQMFRVQLPYDHIDRASADPMYSNYYLFCKRSDNPWNVNNSISYDSGNKIRIKDDSASDLATYKTWLSTHNTSVYYILSTPTYTKITGTLETQLNNIYEKLLSYKGTTNISQVNNDLPFVLGVSAIQDLD